VVETVLYILSIRFEFFFINIEYFKSL